MRKFDQYTLRQILKVFGFFSLVLVAVYWINRAVTLFDELIADGQSARVFVEFSLLVLPNIVKLVLPMAGFAASVYVAARMANDNEQAVLLAGGTSPARLARPFLIFGICATLLSGALAHQIVPQSLYQLSLREEAVREDLSARILRPGQFLHPLEGVTFYTRDITQSGEFEHIFLSDRRTPLRATTYTAQRAFFQGPTGNRMVVLKNGVAQTQDRQSGTLSVTTFEEVILDASNLLVPAASKRRALRQVPSYHFLQADDALITATRRGLSDFALEMHFRMNEALLSGAAILIGFATLVGAQFSRFGNSSRILLAIGGLVVLKFIETNAVNLTRGSPEMWPLLYLPSITGACASAALIWQAGHRFKRGPQRMQEPSS